MKCSASIQLPKGTHLKPVITGKVEHEEFTVEKLHFQSSPGLYVTGNLYLPKKIDKPLPAILYVCGHGQVKKDGIAYGSKAHYQHHGGWFARNGYVCLIIDTLQLGEIEGIHHGTYKYDMWWWINRGYTPAGVEAWNCIRALDYLETRKEVDAHENGRYRAQRRRGIKLVDRGPRRADQGRGADRGDHRPAESRGRWRRRGSLRLHVHGQHLSLGLPASRRPRRAAALAHCEHRPRPDLPARRRRTSPLADQEDLRPTSAHTKTSACRSVGADTTTRKNCKSRRFAGFSGI